MGQLAVRPNIYGNDNTYLRVLANYTGEKILNTRFARLLVCAFMFLPRGRLIAKPVWCRKLAFCHAAEGFANPHQAAGFSSRGSS